MARESSEFVGEYELKLLDGDKFAYMKFNGDTVLSNSFVNGGYILGL